MAFFETLPLSRNEIYQNGKFVDNDIYLTSEGKLWNYLGFQPPESNPKMSNNLSNYVSYNNKLYVIGSCEINKTNLASLQALYIKILTEEDEWQFVTIANTPNFIRGFAVVYDNEIHLLGGVDSSGNGTNRHYTYTGGITINQESTNLPINFKDGVAVTLSDGIHLLGGTSDGNTHYLFNGSSWISKANVPGKISINSGLVKGIAVSFNDKIYIFNLKNTTHTETNGYHWVYSISSGWEELRDLPWQDEVQTHSLDVYSVVQTFVYNNKLHIVVFRKVPDVSTSGYLIYDILTYVLDNNEWKKVDFGVMPCFPKIGDKIYDDDLLEVPSGFVEFGREIEIFMHDKSSNNNYANTRGTNCQTIRYKSYSTYTVSDKGDS